MGLDSVDLVFSVEDEFEIDISDGEAGKIETVGDFYRCILGKLGIAEDQPQAAGVWDRLVTVFREEVGVPPEEVVPEARIVADLGID